MIQSTADTSLLSLLELNRDHSEQFMKEHELRRDYREKHPTEIASLLCMDGRAHLTIFTERLMGIIQPYRSLGGKFDLKDGYFGDAMEEWAQYSFRNGKNCLLFVTYHYSAGDKHRGCKGFSYEKEEAISYMQQSRSQFEDTFAREIVFPVLCGLETDSGALILHGENGKEVNLSTLKEASEDVLTSLISDLYPSMAKRVQQDLLPLLEGNISHIKKVELENRTDLELDHNETILTVGRGLDWLNQDNRALIIGPFGADMGEAIKTAASLIKANVDEGRVQVTANGGLVLLVSAPYRYLDGPGPRYAQQRARALRDLALKIIQENTPEILPHMEFLIGTVNLQNRLFTPLKEE